MMSIKIGMTTTTMTGAPTTASRTCLPLVGAPVERPPRALVSRERLGANAPTGTQGDVMSRQRRLLRFLLSSAVLIAAHTCAPYARAETIITGVQDDLTLEAHDASIQDVLAALGDKFGLRYRNITAIDRRFDGTYEGSLHRVMTRLLDGSSYVMSTDGGHIEVIMVGVAKRNETQPLPGAGVPFPTRRRSD
jgi:hypothetical protein